MNPILILFVAAEAPVLFLFAGSILLLRKRPPDHGLPKLLALEFPLLAIAALGLPLWALHSVLTLGR